MSIKKLDSGIVRDVMLKLGLSAAIADNIIMLTTDRMKEESEAEEKPKKEKKEYLVILDASREDLPEYLEGWVVQKELINGAVWGDLDAQKHLVDLISELNADDKFVKRKGRIEILGDVFQTVPASKAKEFGLSIKTKEPISIIPISIAKKMSDDLKIKNINK